MSTATIETTYVGNSLEMLNEFGVELNLDQVLTEEFDTGLANDVSNVI